MHDLSRQYVEFRMANDFSGMSQEAVPSAGSEQVPQLVAASSSIMVPAWMRPGGGSFAPVAYVPGCSPVAYQTSGLLSSTAEQRRASYYGMMSSIACEHGIPVGLFDAMIMRESSYNPLAASPKNAFGLVQLMPGTAAGLGVNRYDVVQNLRGGAKYLRQQLDRFGQVHLALAAYNAGPGRVKGAVPRIPETQAYVANILSNWSRLSHQAPTPRIQQVSVRTTPKQRATGASVSLF
ncbi:lytic transglycosylase domain-containing protein [Sphingomonas xinjiangensis]|uniref:Transglycosylase SLT domain-containing protein n=1 Tax=Sphingomonas xinjiangensis TaxID=643568 RepID=A0A840YIS7_9SPHN|nr:lytic transglycosylase domain-containing protein [Sphingomonas xinjiangensis]MBB5712365.1 hypothetical protein [Sphingomonas xinjiangensis]